MNPITEAERKIAAILKQLEVDTGNVVDTVELEDMEATTMGSDRREYVRKVVITTHRLPGNHWET